MTNNRPINGRIVCWGRRWIDPLWNSNASVVSMTVFSLQKIYSVFLKFLTEHKWDLHLFLLDFVKWISCNSMQTVLQDFPPKIFCACPFPPLSNQNMPQMPISICQVCVNMEKVFPWHYISLHGSMWKTTSQHFSHIWEVFPSGVVSITSFSYWLVLMKTQLATYRHVSTNSVPCCHQRHEGHNVSTEQGLKMMTKKWHTCFLGATPAPQNQLLWWFPFHSLVPLAGGASRPIVGSR